MRMNFLQNKMVLEKLKNSMTHEEVEIKFYQNLEFGFLNIVDQTKKNHSLIHFLKNKF